MYIEVGPVGININGEKDGKPYSFEPEKLQENIGGILEEIRECLPILKQKAYKIRKVTRLPEVARKMIEAVKIVDESTLTPMAAVAGAVADSVKEHFKSTDLDFISINNGGDISLFSKDTRIIRVGVGDINKNKATPYVLKIESLKDFGIATSGFGGRSFTLGLADIVTVIGKTGAISDAAATFICNRTDVEDIKVLRRKASEIDPMTDIPDELVTIHIGKLSRSVIKAALDNGLCAAYNLKNLNVIYDAVLILKGNIITTIGNYHHITLEVQNGN